MRETDPLLGHSNGQNGSTSTSLSTPSSWTRFKLRMGETVDMNKSGTPLAIQCYIAGAADAAVYSQTSTWAAFMTGNMTQLSMSAGSVLLTHPSPSDALRKLSLSSSALSGFVIGSFLASLVDSKLHSKHRGKLAGFAFIRSIIFSLVAVFVFLFGWEGHNGYTGMALLFIIAANMGTMAVNSSRMGPTPYATTVVFTATLASLFSDPSLPFSLGTASKTRAKSIMCLLLGGLSSQAVGILTTRAMNSSNLLASYPQVGPTGSAFAIALVAVADLLSSIWWLKINKEES